MAFQIIVKHEGLCHSKSDINDKCRMLSHDGEIGMHCNVFATISTILGYKSHEICNKVYGKDYEGPV